MTRTVAFHSFRRGAGTSNILAGCATVLADSGKRVGIIDADLQSPSEHILFGLPEGNLKKTINDYLWKDCPINDVIYDVTPAGSRGKIFLAPASPEIGNIMRIIHEGFEIDKLTEGLNEMSKNLDLDFLFVDTTAGLNEEILGSLATSDILILLLRLDKQDYQGTAVMVSLAQKLEIPRLELIVNHTPHNYSVEQVRREVQEKYQCPVAAIFPHSEEMLALASDGIFAQKYPSHAMTLEIKRLADSFVEAK